MQAPTLTPHKSSRLTASRRRWQLFHSTGCHFVKTAKMVLRACLVTQSCLTLCNPVDCITCQAPLSMGFSRQEYWKGLPFPPPGDLPNPRDQTCHLSHPLHCRQIIYHLSQKSKAAAKKMKLTVGSIHVQMSECLLYSSAGFPGIWCSVLGVTLFKGTPPTKCPC